MKKSPTPLTFAGLMAQSSFSDDELASLREKAWTEQGLFIVHPWDRRLRPSEAQLIRDVAERLYGGVS